MSMFVQILKAWLNICYPATFQEGFGSWYIIFNFEVMEVIGKLSAFLLGNEKNMAVAIQNF